MASIHANYYNKWNRLHKKTVQLQEDWFVTPTSPPFYGEGKSRNEFAEWHVAWLAEWYNFAECNICRMIQRNKLNWKLHPFLAPKMHKQLIFLVFLMLRSRLRWQSKSQEGLLDFSRSIWFFCTATKIVLVFISRAAWQHQYYITKVGHWRKDVWEGHALFCFNFFLQKIFVRLTLLLLPSFAFETVRERFFFRRWVAWPWHDIQRSNVSCILFLWQCGDVSGMGS